MKKSIILALAGVAAVFTANADVKVNLAPNSGLKTVNVSHTTVDALLNTPRDQELKIDNDTYTVKNNSFTIKLSPDGPSRYSIDFDDNTRADFYSQPGENLVVDITSLNPLTYTVKGSELMEGMTYIDSQTAPIVAEFNKLREQPATDPSVANALVERYNKVLTDYIAANPGNPAAVYALLELDGEDYLKALDSLQQGALMSILYPVAMQRKPLVEKQVEKERLQRQLSEGHLDAPDFTLKNLAGNDVSLKQFRGKWVILDFWGSWCIWCIKGFPHLKEVYEANKDRLEVIGIDCQDSEQAWRGACEKYALPWVNLFNPQKEGSIDQLYGVQGFPTKVIINPKGKIMNITTGDDPDFYTKLAELMK